MRICLLLSCLIGLCTSLRLSADDRFGKIGEYSVEANYGFGRIIKQDSKFAIPITGFTHSWELGFYKQTLGKKAWQRKLKYPELGGTFYMAYNDEQKIFGNAYAAMALAKFWIVRSKIVDFYVRIGSGLAYTPTHYNRVYNSENVAIGSAVNSAVQLRLGLDFKVCDHVQLLWGVSFTHYSNSAIQLPNLGVNVPALVVGIRYFPFTSDKLEYNHEKIPKPEKKDEVMMKFSLAINEVSRTIGGPKYATYEGSVNYARYTSIANKVLAGATTEFSEATYNYNRQFEVHSKYGYTGSAMDAGLYVGDEVLIGKLGLFFIVQHNLFPLPTSFYPYVKVGANYYFVSIGKKHGTKFFVGANLKSYYFTALQYEFSTGVAL